MSTVNEGWRGPNIVKDGLAFYLDASSGTSYSVYNSGNTWKDLTGAIVSGSYVSASLINGPNYSETTARCIVFDGTNDFAQPINTGSIFAINNFTIDLWCMPTSTIADTTEATSGYGALSGQRFVTEPFFGQGNNSGAGVSVGTNGIVIAEHSANYIPALLEYSGSISNTVFSNVIITYTSKQPRCYLNGSLVRTGLTSLKDAVNLTLGLVGGMPYGYFAGSLAVVRYYTRTLSTDEILQNYNATKARFGL